MRQPIPMVLTQTVRVKIGLLHQLAGLFQSDIQAPWMDVGREFLDLFVALNRLDVILIHLGVDGLAP